MLFSSCKFEQFTNACTQRKKKQQRLHKANARGLTTRSDAVLNRFFTGDRRELELKRTATSLHVGDATRQPLNQDAKRLRSVYRNWVLFYALLVDNILARHHWERSSLQLRWGVATRSFLCFFVGLLLKNAKKWRKMHRKATLHLTSCERSSLGQKKSPLRG